MCSCRFYFYLYKVHMCSGFNIAIYILQLFIIIVLSSYTKQFFKASFVAFFCVMDWSRFLVLYTNLMLDNNSYLCISDCPTLLECIRFQGRKGMINIAEEISTKYNEFGLLLLNDSNGTRVCSMEHKHREDAQRINTEIL